MMRRLAAALLLLAATLTPVLATVPAFASASPATPGSAALDWAEAHAAGDWYAYGGTGPSAYDCSGLVETAFAHAGIQLPRTTFGMLASPHLHPVPLSQTQRGDLLFYSSGHVEFATAWYHISFGAHDTGTRIGWITWGYGWAPTMAFRVTG